MDFQIIRSGRRTLGLEVRRDGSVLVRAPFRASEKEINAFVTERNDWIETQLNKVRERRKDLDNTEPLSARELRLLADYAMQVIPKRVEYYAPMVGVTYGKITIRNQRTRWGSCSNKGNLNFNCLLMLTPSEVIDSVVVHELCHIKEMNHSEKFYAEVLRVFPEYFTWHKWLKENGDLLMERNLKGSRC